jgi:hypothetical protein
MELKEKIEHEIKSMRGSYSGSNPEICYRLDVLKNIILSELEKMKCENCINRDICLSENGNIFREGNDYKKLTYCNLFEIKE